MQTAVLAQATIQLTLGQALIAALLTISFGAIVNWGTAKSSIAEFRGTVQSTLQSHKDLIEANAKALTEAKASLHGRIDDTNEELGKVRDRVSTMEGALKVRKAGAS